MLIEKKQLIDTLNLVLPGIAKTTKTNYTEQYDSFIFYDNKIISFNDTIAVFLPFIADFNGAVIAKEFYDLIKSLRMNKIDISMTEKDILIKTKNSKSSISLFSDITLPFDKIPDPDEYYDLPDNFLNGLEICYNTVSKDVSEELASYILVQDNHIIATDCYRIIDYKLNNNLPKFFIPFKLSKLLKQYNPVQVSFIRGWLLFRNENDVVIASRTISDKEEFMITVNEKDIINDSQLSLEALFDFNGIKFIFPNEFIKAVMSCRTLTKSCGEDELVKIYLKDNMLNIEGYSENKSKHHERFKIEDNNDKFSFMITPSILIEALKLNAEFIINENALKIQTNDYRQYIPTINEKKY